MEQPQFPPHVPLITRSSRRAPSRRSVATLIFGHSGNALGALDVAMKNKKLSMQNKGAAPSAMEERVLFLLIVLSVT